MDKINDDANFIIIIIISFSKKKKNNFINKELKLNQLLMIDNKQQKMIYIENEGVSDGWLRAYLYSIQRSGGVGGGSG